MYHTIVRGKINQSFAHLNRHEYQPVVESFSTDIQHSFAGNHALGGTRKSQANARLWYERLFRLFPDLTFNVQNVVISGLPHNTRIAVQFRVELTKPDGGRYFNDVAQFVRLQWGKITEMALYEDTDKLVDLLDGMSANGVQEASAPPITG